MPNGYSIKRAETLLGKELQYGQSNLRYIRLSRKKYSFKNSIHEVWDVPQPVEKLMYSLLHTSPKTITEFVNKLNKYTSAYAKDLQQKYRIPFYQIVLYPIGKFLYLYIFKLGILDGTYGFIHAVLMSFHSFLSRGKAYLNPKK